MQLRSCRLSISSTQTRSKIVHSYVEFENSTSPSPPGVQQPVFAQIAVDRGIPITVNTAREAEEDTEKIVKEIVPKGPRLSTLVHVHCFTDLAAFQTSTPPSSSSRSQLQITNGFCWRLARPADVYSALELKQSRSPLSHSLMKAESVAGIRDDRRDAEQMLGMARKGIWYLEAA
ncbi:uncharacterized protein EV420DRAFT_161118 [Desarmillaria tabescens]|uniref:Uncharacterized protein n=1 Tax=Armillaria tabescens TaxID=1929756 RepID=A0AA39JAC8_ARMTA|nr:uncharacterized protein EV420DRAFT_161118 [Desarmillaria tabescens]KAK0437724.1 hypothetical protein EV420DRAFT_161118 [Desarmillaria tabescens]